MPDQDLAVWYSGSVSGRKVRFGGEDLIQFGCKLNGRTAASALYREMGFARKETNCYMMRLKGLAE